MDQLAMESIMFNNVSGTSRAMKMSSSCSSLQRSADGLECQEHARIRVDRPYNSLTKKRKDPNQEYCQRTWINRDDCKDDFWAAIRSNYDYIMDTHLIDSCKEANGELIWDEGDVSTLSWGLKEVSCQFSELYTWLGVLQELVYSKEENLLDKSLRATHMEELQRKAYRRRLFNEQAAKLVARSPSLNDEVAWRVDHLNAKWELVEQIMAPTQPASDQDVSADFEHEVKCLRKWLREMESRLQPLSFRIDWTRSELEEKATEHMVLQKDIEAHGRIVSSVVKLSERVSKQQESGEVNQDKESSKNWPNREVVQAIRVAGSLERRWHLLFLRALEWQCHIETLATRLCNKSLVSCRCSSDSDEEPVIKQPRLSRRHCREAGRENTGRGGRSGRSGPPRRFTTSKPRNREPGVSSSRASDSDMSSGYHNNEDESYFEDDLEQLCVIETKSKISSRGVEKRDTAIQADQGDEGDIEEGEVSDDEMPPTLDPAMSSVSADEVDGTTSLHNVTSSSLKDTPKRRRTLDESSIFNTSDRKSKNCATFYFKHRDTDSEADCGGQDSEINHGMDDSSEEEWTYTASPTDEFTTHCKQVKTNVVVKLDFGETAKVDRIDYIEFKRDNIRNNTIEEMRILEEEEEAVRIKEDNGESGDETKNDIQKLILEVEKLVSEEGRKGISTNLTPLILNDQGQTNYRAKYARIKEWLKLNSTHNHEDRSNAQSWPPLDSCDASGEYTTGESDVEKQSVSSEDLHSSVATYRRCEGGLGCVSQSVSQEIYNDNEKTLVNEGNNNADGTPKVVMRTKRKSDGKRPWSVSCVFGQLNTNNDTAISQFSISETALHQLVSSTPTKAVSLDATGSRAPFNNSTSTLLEENGRVVRNSSIRKKKSRLRKKTFSRKSESGSDGMNANHSGGSDASSTQQRSNIKKSLDNRTKWVTKDCHKCIVSYVTYGSTISCCLHHEATADRAIVTDPPSIKLTCCTPEPSSPDTEENNCGRRNYEDNLLDNVFKRNELISPINGDSDIEKNSLENNSFSEQAWDSYQEKYMSEPYSEAADVETARKLLEFGDDYRNFLDSQSDASSLGAVRSCSSPVPGSRLHSQNMEDSSEDSDSDAEELRRVVDKSYKKLLVMESHFARANGLRPTKDNMEVECVCKENIRCLQALAESDCHRGEKSMKQVRGLTERWENLSHKAEEAQRASVLQRELAAMHLEFRGAYERLISHKVILEPDHVLDERINQITSELATLRERKSAMLALNVSAHRLITDLGAAATSVSVSLKDAVADLYRVWDEAFQRGNQQLCALQAVQQFSTRLTELQNALQRDKDTLAVLDAALQAGATTEVASSVRDVARLLSEKQDVSSQNTMKDENLIEGVTKKFPESGVMSIGQEGGTFSDSGISDSGSEQELSERERRLAALRRLTRSLESQMAPGSDALMELWKRVEDAEAELRSLQKQCRELIVRTAASVEAKVASRNTQTKFSTSKRKKRLASVSNDSLQKSKHVVAEDDPEEDPNLPKSWVWRILRAALPFQLAIVALLCAACLLEPHCCEAANSLSLSLTPQLRYVRGPPPV